jgi:hypothetical protein
VSTVTADQGLFIPAGPDSADQPFDFTSMYAQLESRLVKRYATDADRTARNPSPNAGEVCYLADSARHEKCVVGGGTPVWWEMFSLFARKTAEVQTKNADTTFLSDTHLVLPVRANARYLATGLWLWDSGTTGDIKWQWTGPAGFTVPVWTVTSLDTTATTLAGATNSGYSTSATSAIARAGAGIGTFVAGQLYGEIVTAGTAGNLTVQWAQNASEAVATRMKQESWLKLERVG